MNKRNRRKNLGFTLIELIVVILILGVLAALIVPRVVGRTQDAKIGAAKTDIASLVSMIKSFQVDNDRVPSTQEGLDALRTAPADAKNWKGPYSDKDIPNDPWNNPYQYVSPGKSGAKDSFTVTSNGPDGQPGGDDDISSDSQ